MITVCFQNVAVNHKKKCGYVLSAHIGNYILYCFELKYILFIHIYICIMKTYIVVYCLGKTILLGISIVINNHLIPRRSIQVEYFKLFGTYNNILW